ncbi:hypothetical protein BOO93_16915 [Vibrio navarrensis]|nr:hypothetical protein [Vibrio navarrensis]
MSKTLLEIDLIFLSSDNSYDLRKFDTFLLDSGKGINAQKYLKQKGFAKHRFYAPKVKNSRKF